MPMHLPWLLPAELFVCLASMPCLYTAMPCFSLHAMFAVERRQERGGHARPLAHETVKALVRPPPPPPAQHVFACLPMLPLFQINREEVLFQASHAHAKELGTHMLLPKTC